MRRASPFLLLIAVLFAVIGCAPSYVHYKLADSSHLDTNIVSLSPSSSEIIEGMGLGASIKGRTAADDFPMSIKTRPIVASLKPDYEKIKAISPDLIVYDAQLYNQQDIAQLKQLGFHLFELKANTVKDFVEELYKLSNLVGGPTFFQDYVDRIHVAEQEAEGDKFSSPPKVAFVMPGEGGRDLIAGVNSFQADVIKIAGGVPVGAPSDRFESLDPEMLVAQNPDVIFVPTTALPAEIKIAEQDIQKIKSDPKLQSVNAVKNNHLYPIDQNIALRKGQRVDLLITGTHRALTMAEQH